MIYGYLLTTPRPANQLTMFGEDMYDQSLKILAFHACDSVVYPKAFWIARETANICCNLPQTEYHDRVAPERYR